MFDVFIIIPAASKKIPKKIILLREEQELQAANYPDRTAGTGS